MGFDPKGKTARKAGAESRIIGSVVIFGILTLEFE
jgi:hypothetical protein